MLVFREGLLSAVAHDLLIRVTAFEITVDELRPTPGGHEVHGALTLGGATRPLVLSVRRERGGLASETTLHQPDFGIAPYRAMLGTLRVKPDVVVRASVAAG